MSKSLVAVSFLIASGAAMAQSSVTLYGRVDLSVGSEKKLGAPSTTKMFHGGDGGLTTSRWGFRGTEDLGGGLKASFKVENRFNPDDGTSQDPFFKGESTLSLAGDFGEIKLGRSTTVFDDVIAISNSSSAFDSAFTPANYGVYGSGGNYSSRFNNKVTYLSPTMGGLYAGIDYAFDEDATVKAEKMAVKVGYKAGALNVALAYQDEKTVADYTAISAAYDFGVASVSGGYVKRGGTAATGDDTEYTVGVTVPFGAMAVSAGYAGSKTEVANATSAKASGFGVGATYALSKRTKAYVGYRAHDVKNASGTKTADTRLYAMGIRHDF